MRTGIAVAALGLSAALWIAAPASTQTSARRTPVVEAVQKVAPATVNITTEFRVTQRRSVFSGGDPFFDQFFEPYQAPDRTEQTLGTGAIVDPRGYVLTNAHVLARAEKIWVTLVDGREFPGVVVGADASSDLAVIRIESNEPLPAAPLAQSGDLMIGETVIAIGNPFGLNHTVTTGVLSAINRSFRSEDTEYHGFLQTDASINPGNSGGPLLNLDGEVIGINTAIFREAAGIGFAIPIDRAKRIMDDLIAYGEVVPIWLGLRLSELTDDVRTQRGIRSANGALIRQILRDSPAQRAGMKPGDVLVALDGSPVQSPRNYFEILRGLTEGDDAKVRVERDGAIQELVIRAEVLSDKRTEELAQELLGFTVRNMSNEELQRYGARGLVIERIIPGGPAAQDLRSGDVLWVVDTARVGDRDSYRRAIRALVNRSDVVVVVQRDGQLRRWRPRS